MAQNELFVSLDVIIAGETCTMRGNGPAARLIEERHMEETRRPTRKPRATVATKPAAKPVATKAGPASRKAAVKASAPVVATGAGHDEMVRTAAYFRAQRRGFAPGYEIEDWLAAEVEVRTLVEPAGVAKPRKPAPKKTP